MQKRPIGWLASFAPAFLLLANASPVQAYQLGDKPAVVLGPVIATHYDGVTNDLLTAGLGETGLGSSAAPAVSSPPTAEELRRLAIWTNYRALVDPTPGGGYGTLYGPTATATGPVTNPQGLIPGWEAIGLTRVSTRHANVAEIVTVMVQIPDSYNPAKGCIITAPSSGSRGVYGAIATSGEWGLKHGCAVAYTDKGSGSGADDLHNDTVNLVRGERADAKAAGDQSNFTARLSDAQRIAFDEAYPYRFAYKHAHSQANPESDWGLYVLQAVQFAFYELNQRLSPSNPHAINKSNTIVIASSVSNGGGASLRAVEQDTDHLIDGVAVSEPNVNPVYDNRFVIQQGINAPLVRHSRPLEDYITIENLYAGCAAVAQGAAAPLNLASSPARCNALAAAGLLTSTTTADQAVEAQTILNNYGILPEQNFVSPSHWFAYVHQSISTTYTNQYGKFSVLDNLCGYSLSGILAAATPTPAPLAPAAEATLFGTSNGIPPSAGVDLINNLAPAGPTEDRASTPDQDLRGAICLRGLALGKDPATGAALPADQATQAARVAQGVTDILAAGNLHGVPAIYAVGRNDGVLPPNFAGRAYYGLDQLNEGSRSNLRYYEVTNAQHLDSFNQYPGFNSTLIPLHRYFVQGLDLMYAHLTTGAPLPPSQVVHTIPRGTGAPPITAANVPPIVASPPTSALITFGASKLHIPE